MLLRAKIYSGCFCRQLFINDIHKDRAEHEGPDGDVTEGIIVLEPAAGILCDDKAADGRGDAAAELLHGGIDGHEGAAVRGVGNSGDEGLAGDHPREDGSVHYGIEEDHFPQGNDGEMRDHLHHDSGEDATVDEHAEFTDAIAPLPDEGTCEESYGTRYD